MIHLIDLKKYPIDCPESADYTELVESCKARLLQEGMFDLPGFLLADVTKASVNAIQPAMKTDSYRHARSHNVYFATTWTVCQPITQRCEKLKQ